MRTRTRTGKRIRQGVVRAVRLTHNAMRQFHEREIECKLAGANKLETQEAIRLNNDVIVLAVSMPETGRGLVHRQEPRLSG
jgi:hypothetical protein